ncbi:alpha-2-macroglobulin family protein [Opitutus sp. ER46]|uniref:alpha-2-macroglobulin family protein n=1 Tax=Opitutus sp. ER46 TaxID=2161864 RepID=UPI000D320ECE|nr:alpha-2-macroglobulin family protein [Opitutus sp. ER46]PTX95603.1 hypothetical protein DB354_09305 [Opitutus sp. ER46]
MHLRSPAFAAVLLALTLLPAAQAASSKPAPRFKPAPVTAPVSAPAVEADPTSPEWKAVKEAIDARLPQTAIERLEPIIARATAAKAWPEAIRALAQKIALQSAIQGDKPEEHITRLQAAVATAPMEMKPVLETLLAHRYWQYFQQNRWRFMQRTRTAVSPGSDLNTWDLARILEEIDRHFQAALADAPTLQATPIATYNELLAPALTPDAYRPTLFDFLAHEALSFYQAGEQPPTAAEAGFTVEAAGPVFDDPAAFLGWKLPAGDASAPQLKALDLLQQLLRFHERDADRSAFFDADLARLTYGRNAAVGEDKDARYEAAMQAFISRTSAHEISRLAEAELGKFLKNNDRLADAHTVVTRNERAFPNSPGAAMCRNVRREIEAPWIQTDTEQVWNAPWPTVNVTYRNLQKVYFRAIPIRFSNYLGQARWNFGNVSEEQLQQLTPAGEVVQWSADLPPTPDFTNRTERLTPPTLKPGFYLLASSTNGSLSPGENHVSATPFWVSDLALVLRNGEKEAGGFVLRADTGEPVAGAVIHRWLMGNDGIYEPLPDLTTNTDGRFTLDGRDRPVVVVAESGGHAVSSLHPIYTGRNRDRADRRATLQTLFFTDRAIYRPGQTIHYKGICLEAAPADANYAALPDERVEVVLRDANGEEISTAQHRTNEYGSFSGTFTAPSGRRTGNMTLAVHRGPNGATSISVEEYKRPQFEVALQAPAEAAKLDAPVHLTGKATAYTGAPIGGAKVKWRVERRVQMPLWCWWWQPPEAKAIAHGTAATENDGTFKIEFTAAADRSVARKLEPVFVYSVHADVTDVSGETRSTRRAVRAGYTALRATVTAEDWQTPGQPVKLTVTTESLDGDPQPARGTVRLRALKQPDHVQRAALNASRPWFRFGPEEPPFDPMKPDSWAAGEVMQELPFATDAKGKVELTAKLPAGIYRADLETKDRFEQPVTGRHTVEVIDPESSRYGVKQPDFLAAPTWSVEPGQTFTAIWGTGYDTGRAFVELECAGKLLRSYWTTAGRTQQKIELPVTEDMRGGVALRVMFVRENRVYAHQEIVQVPWSDRQLNVKWERFRSKLLPGEKETWTAIVTGPDAKRTAAEMVAALYDASLDQYRLNSWPERFPGFRQQYSSVSMSLQNQITLLNMIHGFPSPREQDARWRYRAFPQEILHGPENELITLNAFSVASAADRGYLYGTAAPAAVAGKGASLKREMNSVGAVIYDSATIDRPAPESRPAAPDLDQVTARKNLQETAFFFPHLLADEHGEVRIVFTMPEALTRWRFLGFAHDAHLRSGFLTDSVVTAKDLMVQPNAPRFLREGDTVEFSVKVTNLSEQPQRGKIRLTFADAATLQSADAALGNRETEKSFDLPAKEARAITWRITVPDGLGFLTYKAVASTGALSDGEEGNLPMLSRRVLVTESLPLPIRGPATREFTFPKLLASGGSDTLRHQSLTAQMTSQPAWYAVLALPYLMEYPYECSEQVFNRYYANALARHIAKSDPKIRRVFDLWKNTPALDSPLEKNAELKSVALEETPWVRQAAKESQARRNVGLLFDDNRLNDESTRTLQKLTEQQLGEGFWPWFPGGQPSEFITLYITTGFGRLRHLGVDVDIAPARKTLGVLDDGHRRFYEKLHGTRDFANYVPSSYDALYLYGRSFFLEDQPITEQNRPAIAYFLEQARKRWTKINSRQTLAHLAIALQRFGDATTAQAIVRSLKERSVTNEEFGRFWRDQEGGWWWYQAPIETQALMIEMFAEVTQDAQAVEDCQVWLLKQKQTQDWRTTKATADAIYGLLLRGGASRLASDARVELSLGGEKIKPEKVEAGTGFYEHRFTPAEIKPAMGRITVEKPDQGVSWGAVHWQYLEDISKVTPHEGTPLRLKKTLYVKENTSRGPELKPITGPLAVGDELVVRIELRTDRDLEFVHLKDQRGSGTEPVNVLSQYKYQDGFAYYESTRDTASHFFIDYLRKGTFVFEYSVRVQLAGRYQSGIAEIQCMYAPEFNSHSESVTLEVK